MADWYSAFVQAHPFLVGGVFVVVAVIAKYAGDWIKQIIEGGG